MVLSGEIFLLFIWSICVYFSLKNVGYGIFLLTSHIWQFLSFLFPHCICLPSYPSTDAVKLKSRQLSCLFLKGSVFFFLPKFRFVPYLFFSSPTPSLYGTESLRGDGIYEIGSKICPSSPSQLVIFLVC